MPPKSLFSRGIIAALTTLSDIEFITKILEGGSCDKKQQEGQASNEGVGGRRWGAAEASKEIMTLLIGRLLSC